MRPPGESIFQAIGVMNLTLLYIDFRTVIPAKAGIQFKNSGFRVRPGMTNKVKGFLTHRTIEKILAPRSYIINFIL